jgi:uncharacterized protein (TIGR02284 family)
MALETTKVIEECNDLIRFDHDAIGAYDEAIDSVKEPLIREPLVKFRSDHERHVIDLSAIVQRLGGKPAEKPGARGVLRKTLTKVAGLIGTETVLKTMRSNEEVLNKQYANRLTLDFPADVLAVIQRNFNDEKRHLAWVELQLREHSWEAARPSV